LTAATNYTAGTLTTNVEGGAGGISPDPTRNGVDGEVGAAMIFELCSDNSLVPREFSESWGSPAP